MTKKNEMNSAMPHHFLLHVRRLAAPAGVRLCLLLIVAASFSGCGMFPFQGRPNYRFDPIVFEDTGETETQPAKASKGESLSVRYALSKDDSVVGELATVEVRDGDTLADIARHFGLGYEEITAANPALDPWAPEAGSHALLPLEFVLPDAARKGIVVNLAAMRMFYYPAKKQDELVTHPVGIGKEGRATPLGDMFVARKMEHPAWYVPVSIRRDHAQKGDPLPAMVPPGPDNPLGDYAMYLSKPSYLIHGTNKPYAIGLRASNGCLRLYPENIKPLFKSTPVNTPVRIVNQPYLVGWRQGELYLEAHEPHEELNEKAVQNALYAKLKAIEQKHNRPLDWQRVASVISEQRGIPVPVFEGSPGLAQLADHAVALARPAVLSGTPKPPPAVAQSGAWYVGALETGDELGARKAAAVLNHMGPQIPARTVATADGRYRVVAGPFKDGKAAKDVARRLEVDLEMRAEIVPPAGEQVSLRDGGDRPAASSGN